MPKGESHLATGVIDMTALWRFAFVAIVTQWRRWQVVADDDGRGDDGVAEVGAHYYAIRPIVIQLLPSVVRLTRCNYARCANKTTGYRAGTKFNPCNARRASRKAGVAADETPLARGITPTIVPR